MQKGLRVITLQEAFEKSNGNLIAIALRAKKSNNYRNSWKSNNVRKEVIKKEAKN